MALLILEINPHCFAFADGEGLGKGTWALSCFKMIMIIAVSYSSPTQRSWP